MKKAIIFDLDGTLLNTLDDLLIATNVGLERVGLPQITLNDARKFVGNGVGKLIERAIEFAEGRDPSVCDTDKYVRPDNFDDCFNAFSDYYGVHSADNTKPYDGVLDVIKNAKLQGFKTAIVTNKYDGAAQELGKKFFYDVDIVVGAKEGIELKPSPSGVIYATKNLGVTLDDCVYIGDGETDVMTAKNCGIPMIAVTWGFRDRELLQSLEPDYIIDTPNDILTTVSKI